MAVIVGCGAAFLGVVTALGAYQWMTGRLAKQELCVKPNKIP